MGGPCRWVTGWKAEAVIDDQDATTVRSIFRRYLELGSIGILADGLLDGASIEGSCLCKWSVGGERQLLRRSLAQLLQYPIFVGKVKHRDQLFEGEHEAIID